MSRSFLGFVVPIDRDDQACVEFCESAELGRGDLPAGVEAFPEAFEAHIEPSRHATVPLVLGFFPQALDDPEKPVDGFVRMPAASLGTAVT